MNSFAVIGTGFGDEGKGLVTDYLCLQNPNPLVVRFSGGQQAGHTVNNEYGEHVFSNFGSGTLRGVPTYWSRFCTVDPIGVFNELNILKGKNMSPVLYIDSRCPVTTPMDVWANRNDSSNMNNGTCGVGVGKTIQREADHVSLLFGDLFYPSVLRLKIKAISDYYNSPNIFINNFLLRCDEIIKSPHIAVSDDIPSNYETIIFEGSQGLLLDPNIGFFPNVTRINTSTVNILDYKPNVFLVTRSYQTRHGNGYMSNEHIPHNITPNPCETNVLNEFQGQFRRTLLDVDLLSYAIEKDCYIKKQKNKSIIITCLDHVTKEYRFTHKGRVVYCNGENDFIAQIVKIIGVTNVFTSHSPLSNITRYF